MPLAFKPSLLNSANPWASSEEDLQELYDCPYTGAVTTRTSMLDGFPHDPSKHQYVYFDARSSTLKHEQSPNANSSINTLGYSPIALAEYLDYIESIVTTSTRSKKPFIVSVTGTADELATCHRLISQRGTLIDHPLLMEVNLSCPNITDKPPPAFSGSGLEEYLSKIIAGTNEGEARCTWGIKTPPYTYLGQFHTLIDALLSTAEKNSPCPVSFITATNTLGNCLILVETLHPNYKPAVESASGDGIGGVGGAAMHPLALGNVKTIRDFLDRHEQLRHIEIIGVGGCQDFSSYERFMNVGAAAVAVGTALGREGVGVFEKIAVELDTVWHINKLKLTDGHKAIDGIRST